MLSRLGLVIHLLGFAASCSMLIWGIKENGTHFSGCVDVEGTITYIMSGCYYIDIEVIQLSVGSAAFFLLTGWGIRFILSGHKSPLPWVANKESSNG